MGADQQIDLAGREPRQEFAALLALLAAGQDRNLHAGALCQRRDGLDVLACQDFGRCHQRRLLAGLSDRGRRQQRHHGLAGTDIALHEAQHPHRLVQILRDRRDSLLLRFGQRIGQGIDDLVAQMAVAGIAHTGRPPQRGADQRQRELAGQQFVECKPRPERTIGQDVGQLDRNMDAGQCLPDRREVAAAQHLGTDPLRQIGQLGQRLRDGAAERADRKPLGQRIDRIDAGEFRKAGLVDHPIRMHDLRDAVIHRQRPGNVALLSDRQQLLDIVGLGAEEGQHDIAGVVAGINEVGRARIARRRRAMAVDGDLQRHHGSDSGIADLRPGAAVDHARRQMQQEVDQPRRLAAVEQVAQQSVLLRADARKRRNLGK